MSRFSLVFSLMLSSTLGSSALYALKSTVAERHKSAFSKILSPGTEDVAYKAAHIMTENPAISQKEAVAQALSPAYTKGYQGEAIALRVAGRALQGEGFMLAQRALTIEGCAKDLGAFQFGGKNLAQKAAELFVDSNLASLDEAKEQTAEGVIKVQAASLDDAQLKTVAATMCTNPATSLKKVLAEQFSVDYQVGGAGKQYKLGNCVAAKILEGRNVLQAQADTKNEMQFFVNKLGKNIDVQGHVADNARRIACLDALEGSDDFKLPGQGWTWALRLSDKDLACYYRAANNLTPRCVGQWKVDRVQKETDAKNRYNSAVDARTAWKVAEDQEIKAGNKGLFSDVQERQKGLGADPKHPDRVIFCKKFFDNQKNKQQTNPTGTVLVNLEQITNDPFFKMPELANAGVPVADDINAYKDVAKKVKEFAKGQSYDSLQIGNKDKTEGHKDIYGNLIPPMDRVVKGIETFFSWGTYTGGTAQEKSFWRKKVLTLKDIFCEAFLGENLHVIGLIAEQGLECQNASKALMATLLNDHLPPEKLSVEQRVSRTLAELRLAIMRDQAERYVIALIHTSWQPEYSLFAEIVTAPILSLPSQETEMTGQQALDLRHKDQLKGLFAGGLQGAGFFAEYTPDRMVQKVIDILEPTHYTEGSSDKSKIYLDQLIPVLQKLKPWCNMTTEQLEEADDAAGVILDDNYAIKKDFVKQLLIELGYLKIK